MSCAKIVAELVVRDLADEGGVEAQRGRARHGVGRRAAADFARRAHRRIEIVGLARSSAAASSPSQAALLEERIVGGRDHVDDRIADRQDVEAGAKSPARR